MFFEKKPTHRLIPTAGINLYKFHVIQMSDRQLEAELKNSLLPSHYRDAARKEIQMRKKESKGKRSLSSVSSLLRKPKRRSL